MNIQQTIGLRYEELTGQLFIMGYTYKMENGQYALKELSHTPAFLFQLHLLPSIEVEVNGIKLRPSSYEIINYDRSTIQFPSSAEFIQTVQSHLNMANQRSSSSPGV